MLGFFLCNLLKFGNIYVTIIKKKTTKYRNEEIE